MAFANDGVAGVPGTLHVVAESADGAARAGGALDAGHPYGGKLRQAALLAENSSFVQSFDTGGTAAGAAAAAAAALKKVPPAI